uniref:Uncharacterized protein n=1 Tax=Kalanchoe fedtschenkoi TaxID=63787 RepID=A0A7N0ZWF1_KALFE
MFLGMFVRKPEAEAMKKLNEHMLIFRVWVLEIRATPYVLYYLSGEKDEFKMEF